MTFNEILANVLLTTSRPDKTVSASKYINEGITFSCLEGSFARDRAEQEVTPTFVSDNIYTFALSLLTRFRKFDYIRNGKNFIKHLEPSRILTQNGDDACNVYYVVGDEVKLRVDGSTSLIKIGYFQYPPVLTTTTGSNTYWLLEVSPYMIADYAIAKVFAEVGNTVESNKHMDFFRLALTSAIRDYKYGANYG
jgi:hypothetical protein